MVVLAAFFAGLISIALALAWLVDGNDNQVLYLVTVLVFGAQLVMLGVCTVRVLRRVVWS